MSTPYDVETMLLGATLEWGKSVASIVLPRLTADKFIYGNGESLGNGAHRAIWAAIEHCVLVDRAEPFVGNVTRYLPTDFDRSYLEALRGLLLNYHHVHHADVESIRSWATEIDKNGIIYRYATMGAELGKAAAPEVFMKYVSKIEDVDVWATAVLREFQGAVSIKADTAYVPIASVVAEGKELWARQAAGEQLILLPSGWPSLYQHGLFPVGKFAIVHGWQSAGKSMFVHLVNLGTAIGLVKNNMRGCVAINSLEMSSIDFARRCASALAGFNAFTLLGEPAKIDPVGYKRFNDYLDFVGKLPIAIDSTPGISATKMHLNITGLNFSDAGPVRQLSTDYFELFGTSDNGRNMSESSRERELAHIANAHYLISREVGCSVIGISQSTYNAANRNLIAGPDGMRYSRALGQKADIVMEVINYKAAENSGKDFTIRPGLDKERFWLLLQKYKEGPVDEDIALGWMPEYTRLYDPMLMNDFGGESPLFDHLAEVQKMLAAHPTTQIIPIEDTPLADMEF